VLLDVWDGEESVLTGDQTDDKCNTGFDVFSQYLLSRQERHVAAFFCKDKVHMGVGPVTSSKQLHTV
jgi:hypothetical protein